MSLSVRLLKRFDNFKLDIEFTMGNELLVLFGPSGAGKSVTLKMIAGLLRPEEGYLKLGERKLFDHQDQINIKPQQRSIGYVFQNHSIFPHMTVQENIIFAAGKMEPDMAKGQTAALLERFNLVGLNDKYPPEISGGQQQRVALAMSLIRSPKALLLDEPFSALDGTLRATMGSCVKEVIKKFNLPIVLVTHDAAEACNLADKILLIKNGTVIKQIDQAFKIQHADWEKSLREL